MTKARALREYAPFVVSHGRELDIAKVERLHIKVGDYKERLVDDPKLQDLLLNEGYQLVDAERPESLLDIPDATILRTQTVLHLVYLNRMIDLATRPRVLVVREPGIVLPGQDADTKLETSEGYCPEKLEELQRRWLTETETVRDVRKFQDGLVQAMDEFDMKMVLNRMLQARSHYIPFDKGWEEVGKLREEIEEVWEQEAYLALDSAYYNRGRALYSGVGQIWERLRQNEFGKQFTLSEKEIAEVFRRAI